MALNKIRANVEEEITKRKLLAEQERSTHNQDGGTTNDITRTRIVSQV